VKALVVLFVEDIPISGNSTGSFFN
jgi:hypothetical protein